MVDIFLLFLVKRSMVDMIKWLIVKDWEVKVCHVYREQNSLDDFC